VDAAGDQTFEQAVECLAADRAPALVVQPVEVATEPAGRAGEKSLDRPDEVVVAALRSEADTRHPLLAGPRKRDHRVAGRAEGADAASQPRLEGGGRPVVGKREARLRRVESLELGGEDVEAALDQPLRFGQGQLRLVRMAVAVRHHVMAAPAQLVPELEVAFGPPVVPRLLGLAEVAGRDDVQLGDETMALEDLRRAARRPLEAVVEAQRDDVHGRAYSVARGSTV
jgi:hypothetical protein